MATWSLLSPINRTGPRAAAALPMRGASAPPHRKARYAMARNDDRPLGLFNCCRDP